MLNNLYKWLVYVGVETLTLKGWATRGSSNFKPTIVLDHWIAGARGAKPGTRPGLSIVRDGHGSLPGPLCQVYLGRAGEAVTVAAGRANHAGYGYWKGVTGNTGSAGIEAEAADNSDWTEEMKKSYPLVNIAILFAMWEKGHISWNQIASNRVAGHSEFALPKGRKVDINGYTMSDMRSQVAALIPGFKKRVNKKAIKVGANPVFDRDTYKFTDGTAAPKPRRNAGSSHSSKTTSSGNYKGNSIVDYLNSIGESVTFSNRAKLAQANGISNYRGTAAQNTKLLNKLRSGKSSSSGSSSSSNTGSSRQSSYTGNSIVDYLASIGQPTSFAHRRTLAKRHGMSNYTGTSTQNTRLLRSLRAGGTSASSSSRKSVKTLAREVLDGKHGDGAARKRSLGSRYDAVQREVNRMLG